MYDDPQLLWILTFVRMTGVGVAYVNRSTTSAPSPTACNSSVRWQ